MTVVAGLLLSTLADELSAFDARVLGSDVRLTDVCQDSRAVTEGALFVARVGDKSDGRAFIAGAVEAGAVAVMLEHGTEVTTPPGVSILYVSDIRRAMGFAAEAVHGFPSRRLALVGITGTNGKTTTASLVRQCLGKLGHPTAQLGTLGFEFGDDVRSGSLTTPESDAVSRFLAQAVNGGATHAVMEVSSHALDQGRVDALSFSVAAFSNLTQDHLDYHGTLEAYGAAKARLFRELSPKWSVLNADDKFGRQLADELGASALSVGRGDDAHVGLRRTELGPDSTCLEISVARARAVVAGVTTETSAGVASPGSSADPGTIRLETTLVGEHNVDNWLLTVGIVCALGIDVRQVPQIAKSISSAPGRMDRCEGPDDDLTVLVDYAHTPDALERALVAARSVSDRRGARLHCVFGCGGDRDRSKRPRMGAAVARLADIALITNDNPRSEEPGAIASEIEAGMRGGAAAYKICLDREQAIFVAISSAEPGDVVLIAGKGHEDYQLIGSQRLSFDDRIVARHALAHRRKDQG